MTSKGTAGVIKARVSVLKVRRLDAGLKAVRKGCQCRRAVGRDLQKVEGLSFTCEGQAGSTGWPTRGWGP